MIWIIAAIVLSIIIIIHNIRYYYDGIGDGIFMSGLIVIAMLVGSFLPIIASSAIAEVEADKTYYLVDDTDIYALQDNVGSSGTFFLGSGRIEDKAKYFYVVETDFGYAIRDVDVDGSYIKYTDDRCHIETYSYEFTNPVVKWFAIPMNNRYIFYIPEGSIINNYNMDLK